MACLVSFTGKTMSPQVMFHNTASNIICQVIFGTRFEHDDEMIKVFVQCFTEITKIANGPWAMVSQSIDTTKNIVNWIKEAESDQTTPPTSLLNNMVTWK